MGFAPDPGETLGGAEGAASCLVSATKLVRVPPRPLAPRGWVLTLYPEAGEAGGAFRSARPRRPGLWVPAGAAADPERAEAEASRRARARVRRYCVAYGLTRLTTLTYAGAGCFDIDEHVANAGRFWRELRKLLDVAALPYVRVWEWHPGGHGLHEHFAVGRYVKRWKINAAWALGRVDIRLIKDLPVGSTVRDEARQAARYMAPYLSKGGGERPMGRHRYEVAQGFPIASEQVQGPSALAVLDAAAERMGGWPNQVWHSDDNEDWNGPPAAWAAWR